MRGRWVAVWVVAACWAAPAAASAAVQVHVVSNRADLVSGGDALVEVTGADPAAVRVDVGGRDVTDAFAVRRNGRFQGLLRLRRGANVVTARRRDGSGARLMIRNHPIGGPVFAGPQTQPWLCRTEENGLGPALDAQCNARTKVEWLYKSTNPAKSGLQPYDPANPPADVATATTDHAGRVPFIVRVERGIIDRGIYEIAVLADPKQPWKPWAPQRTWNGKLYWPFGGDCQPNHVQPAPGGVGGDARNETVLGRGFATAASGLTVLGLNCNSVVSAEAVMMIKERIVETLGPIRYTMSEGCSGGSMQQHWHVSNYPGLLDGIQPSCSYPDIWTTLQQAEDCHVLDHYFREVSPHLWAAGPQQEAVTGYAAPTTCASLWDGPPPFSYAQNWLDPDNYLGCLGGALSGGNTPGVTQRPEWVYDARTNRSGVRCTLQDYMASVFGRRASDGFGHYPYDNVGVQYGLAALNSGQIIPEQFVDLNEKVGGIDIDWNYQPRRSVADAAAVQTMYRAGLVTYGREAAKVPIIDLRASSNYEIHTDFHSYSMRARLQKASGHADNQIIWTSSGPFVSDDPKKAGASFDLLDTWLSRVERDTSDLSLEQKVLRNRPASAVDACWIGGEKVTDMQKCRAAFPYYADPRIAAGGPLADDIVKCTLKPLDRRDYEADFSDAQWERLRQAFPDGVCDYSRPGVGQQPSLPWMTFADGPGGRPLGRAPRSRRCVSRRRLSVQLRGRGGQRLRSARIYVNGRRVRVVRGDRRRVVLRRLPAGVVRVKVVARTRSGRRIVRKLRYRTCPGPVCVSRRRLSVWLRGRDGQRLRSARIYVNGRRVRVVRGDRRRVVLRGLPAGVVRVKVVARTRSGRRIVRKLRYRTCPRPARARVR